MKTKSEDSTAHAPLTPMIDVVFQMIIFFIIAGRIASDEIAQLKLPDPTESQALKVDETQTPNRVIVNVVSADADQPGGDPIRARMAKSYVIGGRHIDVEDTEALLYALEDRKKSSKEPDEFVVEVRADRRVSFSEVQPVLVATAKAKIQRMNLAALLELSE